MRKTRGNDSIGARRLIGVRPLVIGAISGALVLAGCGGSSNDPLAQQALVQASLKSAAAKSYVAVVGAGGHDPVTFTFSAPDRLRAEQGTGKSAVVFVQVALTGYHSDPTHPGYYTKKLENVAPTESAPLNTLGDLITRATHVSRKGRDIRFDVSYGGVKVQLLVAIDARGRIGGAELPVFDSKQQVESYKYVTFGQYDQAPPVQAPKAALVTPTKSS